ncbi:HD-GYP domain-containing protein [Pedococcus sp. KACC 23699]|uniref:HD-GYP domain-containing protein n=1 Tax=Pedococcus sp. KACC 23699 TaxID=3149228 RepID=A0AAU7JQI2_9MICO
MKRWPSRVGGAASRTVLATRIYVGAVSVAAVGMLGLGYMVAGRPYEPRALLVLTVLALAGWMLKESDTGNRVRLSFTSIVLLASAVIVGPVGCGVIGALANLTEVRRGRKAVWLFNAAMNSVIGSVGGLVYLLLGGENVLTSGLSASQILLGVGAPLLAADICQCLVNAVMLAGVMRASGGPPVLTQIVKLLSTSGIAYVGYGLIGFLLVVLWIPAGVGWFSAVLVLAPLLVARWAFVQYGDELRAHDRTLSALVAAVETKDPANAGHSDRTAQLAEWLAETLGLGHKEIQDVRTAAMLHDIGKVCVPTKILRAKRELTDDELVVMAEHALSGVDLVRGITFLAGSVDGIAHHHERFDGRGYPGGLSGDQIPLAARIIAVADTFDTLTTSRPYRSALHADAALGVLAQRAGSQFDPAVVEALRRALGRREWATTDRSPGAPLDPTAILDHDEPEISDLFALRDDLRARVKGATTSVAIPLGGRV